MKQSLVLENRERPGVRLLTLNRPEKRNALNVALMELLHQAIRSASEDDDVRVIVLQGAGPAFCAGLDLHEASDSSRVEESAEWVARILTALHETPKVTIAAVHGAAMAGGAGLVTGCDLAVAGDGTIFAYPEVRRGLVAAIVLPFLLRRVRESDARELLLAAEPVSAARALAMGLVNRMVPDSRVLEEALALADSVAQGAPQALAVTKRLLDALSPAELDLAVERALQTHTCVRASGEAEEGIKSFLEKRPPGWLMERTRVE